MDDEYNGMERREEVESLEVGMEMRNVLVMKVEKGKVSVMKVEKGKILVMKVVRRPVRGSVRITVAPGTGVASRPE